MGRNTHTNLFMDRKFFEENLKNDSEAYIKFLHRINMVSDGCWNFIGSIHKNTGYGTFVPKRYHHINAHRASYLFHKGKINDGNVIMHSCDNRKCVNPDHLLQGTQKENMEDHTKKGRDKYNEEAAGCKITKEQVNEIRNLSLNGIKYSEISRKYNISKSLVCMIVKNKRRIK